MFQQEDKFTERRDIDRQINWVGKFQMIYGEKITTEGTRENCLID